MICAAYLRRVFARSRKQLYTDQRSTCFPYTSAPTPYAFTASAFKSSISYEYMRWCRRVAMALVTPQFSKSKRRVMGLAEGAKAAAAVVPAP